MNTSQLKTIRIIAWCIIVVLAAWYFLKTPEADKADVPTPVSNVTQPFTLTSASGKPFTEKDLAGKPSMMFFGFSHCPAICPGAMADMGIWLGKLGSDAKKINAVFVSVDPERDTPKRLKEFLADYDKRIIGLSGTAEQTASIAKSYGIYYKKMPAMDDGNYMVDHSASIYLYDKNRQLISTIDATENRDIAFAKIKKLLSAAP